MEDVFIKPPFIKLEQFLKLAGATSTGGQAKNIITDRLVLVNGEVCTQRGKKLFGSEKVEISGEETAYRCCVTVNHDT